MTKEEANRRYRNFIDNIGREALGALFPKDFEVYMMGLELVDSDGDTVDYFLFPVMPQNISKSEPELTNIKKTAGGISILSTNNFIPETVSINGDFGRTFKVLIGSALVDFKALGIKLLKNSKGITAGTVARALIPFSRSVKTGYGCTKIMQGILKKSVTVDYKGQPHRLYFHNPTLGEAHLVEKESFSLTMDEGSSNRVWQYSLSLTTIATIGDVRPKKRISSLQTMLVLSKLQQGANIFAKGAKVAISENSAKNINTLASKTRDFFKDTVNSVTSFRIS